MTWPYLAQRCVLCGRVRTAVAAAWVDHPGKLAGEVSVTCKTCGDARSVAQNRYYWRSYNSVQRKKAKGYGQPKDGEDVFKGMR